MNISNSDSRQAFRLIVSTIALLFVLGVLITAVIVAADIFLILLFSILFSVFLYRSSHFLEGKLWNRYSVALSVVTVLFFAGVLIGLGIFAIQVDRQVDQASQHLNKAQQRITALLDDYPVLESTLASTPFLDSLVNQRADSGPHAGSTDADQAQESESGQGWGRKSSMIDTTPIKETVNRIFSAIASLFRTTFGLLVNSLLIFFVGLFIAVNPQSYRDGIVSLFPKQKRIRTCEIMDELGETLWRWLLGRFGSMLITGVGAGLLLLILGVPMAVSLGIVTALLTFIPNIGGLISLILAVIFSLPQGLTVVTLVIVGYIILQLIESYVVTPMIQKKQVSLPPALLIAFQAIMGGLFGLLGAAAASPILAVGKKFIELVYIHDVLEAEE